MSMTREEAIERLSEQCNLCKGIYECSANPQKSYPEVPKFMEALGMALTALRPVSREQIEKAWRSFWEQGDIYDFGDVCQKCGYDSGNEPCRMSFCPACGAPMTDEAVQMVMERLEAMKDGKGD